MILQWLLSKCKSVSIFEPRYGEPVLVNINKV
jgi:hypothetical protein